MTLCSDYQLQQIKRIVLNGVVIIEENHSDARCPLIPTAPFEKTYLVRQGLAL